MSAGHIENLNGIASSEVPEGVVDEFVGISSRSSQRYPTGQHACQGLYWWKQGTQADTVFMLTHYTADYMEHYLAGPLALRGYGVLGWNTRFTGAEDRFILEDAIDDMAAGVEWLRKKKGARNVVFIRNSGSGSLMAAYTARANQDSSYPGPDAYTFWNALLQHAKTRHINPGLTAE